MALEKKEKEDESDLQQNNHQQPPLPSFNVHQKARIYLHIYTHLNF